MYKNKLKRFFITAQYKNDFYISLFVTIYFLISCSGFTLKQVLNVPESLHFIVNFCFATFLSFFGIIAIWSVLRRSFIFFMCIESLGIIMYIASYLQGGLDFTALQPFFRTLGYILIGVFAYSIKDKQVFYNLFLKLSYVMFAIVVLNIFFPAKSYDMTFSYAVLTPTLFHINEWLSNRKKRYLFLFSAEIIMIFWYGSRGTLLCIGVFCASKFLISQYSLTKKLIVSGFSLAAIVLFLTHFEKIMLFIFNYLNNVGYSSRTIYLFASGMATDSGTRTEIYQYYFSLIQQNPIFGWGVRAGWDTIGGYPHNIVIEFICSFGYIVGILFCCIVFILSCKIFLQEDKISLDVGLIFFSCSIPRLMISHSFLMSSIFWVFIALSLSVNKSNLHNIIFCKLKGSV